LRRTRCTSAQCDLEPYDDDTEPTEVPPCPRCGAPLRPDIVLFEEPLPAEPDWLSKRALRDCDVFLAVGTSGTVSPASNFVRGAKYAGAYALYVNLEPLQDDSAFDDALVGPAETILPELLGRTTSMSRSIS
jgi:NAD-dependent deacetylase